MKTIMKTRARVWSGGLRHGMSWKHALLGVLLVPAGVLHAAEAEPVAAAAPSAWFVEVSAGVSIVPGGDLEINGVRYEAEYDNGQLIRGAVGRRFAGNWAAAVEFSYRSNNAESFTGGGATMGGGDLASTNVFLQLTYTADERFSLLGFRPSVGVGAGLMQEVDIDLEGFGNEEFSDSWALGWQWSVAVGRPVGRAGWFFVEGRAISGGKLDLKSSTQDRTITFDYDAWALLAGVRWTF